MSLLHQIRSRASELLFNRSSVYFNLEKREASFTSDIKNHFPHDVSPSVMSLASSSCSFKFSVNNVHQKTIFFSFSIFTQLQCDQIKNVPAPACSEVHDC